MKIIPFSPRNESISDDAPQVLRDLADRIEKGEVTEMILACVEGGEYSMFLFSSLTNSLALSALYHQFVLDRFRA